MKIKFHIYLSTETKWVHLEKEIEMSIVPRIGEYVKFENDTVGDYFGYQVVEVEYHEHGAINMFTDVLHSSGKNSNVSFKKEVDFMEYYKSYLQHGWESAKGIRMNPHKMKQIKHRHK